MSRHQICMKSPEASSSSIFPLPGLLVSPPPLSLSHSRNLPRSERKTNRHVEKKNVSNHATRTRTISFPPKYSLLFAAGTKDEQVKFTRRVRLSLSLFFFVSSPSASFESETHKGGVSPADGVYIQLPEGYF